MVQKFFSNKELRNFEVVLKTPHYVCDYVNLLVCIIIEKRSVCKQRNKRAKLKNGSVPRRGKSAESSAPPTTEGWGEPKLLFCAGLQLQILGRGREGGG